MSEVKVNKISPRTNCGTVTLGDSGNNLTVSNIKIPAMQFLNQEQWNW